MRETARNASHRSHLRLGVAWREAFAVWTCSWPAITSPTNIFRNMISTTREAGASWKSRVSACRHRVLMVLQLLLKYAAYPSFGIYYRLQCNTSGNCCSLVGRQFRIRSANHHAHHLASAQAPRPVRLFPRDVDEKMTLRYQSASQNLPQCLLQ